MSSWVYLRSEPRLWTVGYYNAGPSGEFVPESDHDSSGEAAARVRWLNGEFAEPVELAQWQADELLRRAFNADPKGSHPRTALLRGMQDCSAIEAAIAEAYAAGQRVAQGGKFDA